MLMSEILLVKSRFVENQVGPNLHILGKLDVQIIVWKNGGKSVSQKAMNGEEEMFYDCRSRMVGTPQTSFDSLILAVPVQPHRVQ